MNAATGVLPARSDAPDEARTGAHSAPAAARVRAWLTRPPIATVVLFLVYLTCSAFDDPRGFLGTDTGAKVATLEAMQHRHSWVPDVGYWAARWDPHAALHPLYDTIPVGRHFVDVTTLPMILVAHPLWAIGGYRLALVLPMMGAVAVALAALALARRLGAQHPMTVFWIVGLASPAFVYALDLWEHTIGLALMAWGVVLLYDTWSRRAGWKGALAAGALFGAAASMRTEALLYGAVATAVVCLAIAVRERTPWLAARIGASALVGVGALWVANDRLERLVLGGSLRESRAAGTAGAAGSDLVTRAGEALRTALGMNYASVAIEGLAGGCFFLALVGAAWFLAT
jgi:hypothetical protein